MPVGEAVTVKVGDEEHESACAWWQWRWKYKCGLRAGNGRTLTALTDIPFVRVFKMVDYRSMFSELIRRLCEVFSVPTKLSLSL